MRYKSTQLWGTECRKLVSDRIEYGHVTGTLEFTMCRWWSYPHFLPLLNSPYSTPPRSAPHIPTQIRQLLSRNKHIITLPPMEDSSRHQKGMSSRYANSPAPLTPANKREKRRHHVATKLSKLEMSFAEERNNFYRAMLVHLQSTLASIQLGVNEEYQARRAEQEEIRDYELTRLRLWEEYQVKRVEDEYKEDMAMTKENYDMLTRLLKEKFYDKLQRQVKQLKEDKLLLNLVNASLWTPNGTQMSTASAFAAAAPSFSMNDRRSLRKRELHARLLPGEADDLSDTNSNSGATRNSAAGYISASGKRRRHYATRHLSNDELSSGMTNTSNNQHNGERLQYLAGGGNESNLSDKDYDTLNSLIANKEEGGVSEIFVKRRAGARPNTRQKQFVGVQGLKVEELNDDLAVLRNAVKQS